MRRIPVYAAIASSLLTAPALSQDPAALDFKQSLDEIEQYFKSGSAQTLTLTAEGWDGPVSVAWKDGELVMYFSFAVEMERREYVCDGSFRITHDVANLPECPADIQEVLETVPHARDFMANIANRASSRAARTVREWIRYHVARYGVRQGA
jgi:hypothetical protein